MRDQGRLVEWFDDKGYGFIQPNDTSKDRVFLHIKAFAKAGPRPIVGCALDYRVGITKGRYQAEDVKYLKAKDSTVKHVKSKVVAAPQQKLKPMQILCIGYIVSLAILVMAGMLSGILLLGMSLMNALSYWLYAQDKEAAQLGHRRVPENTLHLVAFLGGWPAAWLAQEKLRHKTQKQPFRQIYFCTIAFNIMFILWIISPFNMLNI